MPSLAKSPDGVWRILELAIQQAASEESRSPRRLPSSQSPTVMGSQTGSPPKRTWIHASQLLIYKEFPAMHPQYDIVLI